MPDLKLAMANINKKGERCFGRDKRLLRSSSTEKDGKEEELA
jgi:hypothetical protein